MTVSKARGKRGVWKKADLQGMALRRVQARDAGWRVVRFGSEVGYGPRGNRAIETTVTS